MKLKQVLEAHAAINELIKNDRANKWVLASAVRIKLAGNLRKTRAAHEDYTEERNKLIEKFGTETPDGAFQVSPGTQGAKDFIAAEKPLQSLEIDFVPNPIKQADLGENQIPIDLIAVLLDTGLMIE